MRSKMHESLWMTAIFIGAFCGGISRAEAGPFVQTNLVSDIPGLALITDADLKNPWGISHSATSPFWVSDQGTGVATLYSVTGAGVSKAPLTVNIPATGAGPQGPTGQVFNTSTFLLSNGNPALFIFANLNGTISAWNGGTTAQIAATTPGAVYTGLTLPFSAPSFLFAANNAQGRIDVFDTTFQNVTGTLFAGKFVDPNLPAGYVPFNVQSIGSQIFVTYALAGRPAEIAAIGGQGFVAVYDLNGNFIRQIGDSHLASPWGITLAPASFGPFGNDLLVGNFSFALSEINAFDPATGAFLGTIPIDTGGIAPGGLWGLSFGNNGAGGAPNTLFFTDGLNGESNGLFASLAPLPEPPSLALLAAVLGALCLLPARSRRQVKQASNGQGLRA